MGRPATLEDTCHGILNIETSNKGREIFQALVSTEILNPE